MTSAFSSFLGTAAFSVIVCSGDAGAPRPKTIKVRDVQAGPAGCPIWVPHVGCGAIYIVRRAAERFLSVDYFIFVLFFFPSVLRCCLGRRFSCNKVSKKVGFKSLKMAKTGYYNYADIDDNFISIHHWLKWYKFGFTRIFDNLSILKSSNLITSDNLCGMSNFFLKSKTHLMNSSKELFLNSK